MSKENIKIGKLIVLADYITEPPARDAIHVAIAPVTAGEDLKPGTHVGFYNSNLKTVVSKEDNWVEAIGIVDPFLKEPVKKDEHFYMFLYPGTITNLRHHWSHPAFTVENEREENEYNELNRKVSEEWLRKYAVEAKPYDHPELAIKQFFKDLENPAQIAVYFHGKDSVDEDFRDGSELLKHISIYLGRKVTSEDVNYSCSC